MLRFLLFIFVILFLAVPVAAQNAVDSSSPPPDTVRAKSIDTTRPGINDTMQPPVIQPVVPIADDSVSWRPTGIKPWQPALNLPLDRQILQHHPYYDFNAQPIVFRSGLKEFRGKELLFYVIIALLIVFALLRMAFSKYFTDLFRVFFRTTMKQRQISEQLIQSPLPSLLLNMFFVASAGLYIAFLFGYFHFMPVDNFWILYMYTCIGLCVIYLVKFVGLKLCGWLFNMRQAADSYIFIVFIINKMIGLFLLPVLPILAFSPDPLYSIAIMISWCGIGGLLLYRFILGYSAVRNEVRFNLFHFFLYICAFEIAPLLLIYRALLFLF